MALVPGPPSVLDPDPRPVPGAEIWLWPLEAAALRSSRTWHSALSQVRPAQPGEARTPRKTVEAGNRVWCRGVLPVPSTWWIQTRRRRAAPGSMGPRSPGAVEAAHLARFGVVVPRPR